MDSNMLSILPEEILQETLRFVDRPGLFNLALSCRWCYQKAVPLIWEDVELVDCRSQHTEIPDISNEHDDTPIISKLLILASNEWIASHVLTLTHRCHLPPPAIFYELPRTSFQGRTLSHDVRTLRLLQLACNNLTNLQTLRVIFGHWNITRGLLTNLLDRSRKSRVRRLWLENCSIAGLPYTTLERLDLGGLESLRLRRLPVLNRTGYANKQKVYYRGSSVESRQDGRGGLYTTTTQQAINQEVVLRDLLDTSVTSDFKDAKRKWEHIFETADRFDDIVHKNICDTHKDLAHLFERTPSEQDSSAMLNIRHILSPDMQYLETDPFFTFQVLLRSSAHTLTSLNLDWLLTRRTDERPFLRELQVNEQSKLFHMLFGLRFPCLRAFQLRNAVVAEAELPPGLYLLDMCSLDSTVPPDLCIRFMEAHSNLRCLAWPAERFFRPAKQMSSETTSRVSSVITSLGSSLQDLRVDAIYNRSGEFKTDNSTEAGEIDRRASRRRFVSEFAAHMKSLEYLKIEGGIARDEKRETIRALHACPLRRVVLIGVNCPIGNTWGFCGREIGSLGINENPNDPDDFGSLESEDVEEITRLSLTSPEPSSRNQVFEAEYGWPPSAPFIHTIASQHASTITELKFCGYRGAPLLWDHTPITTAMLSPLRHLHNLHDLIISLWLQTLFEGDHRDEDIIAYWLNSRDASSTALIATSTDPPTGWAKELAERYEPSVMAQRIVTFIGPFLSERAKARHGGLHVRASFCIGEYGGLFDFDVVVGKAGDGSDVLRSWKGPREELFPERRVEKLERRRWF